VTTSILSYLRYRRETALAEAAPPEECIAQAEQAGNGFDSDLCSFNPACKRGLRLTTLGRYAVEHAFECGMRQSEVAQLFQISLTRAHELHRDWLALRTSPSRGGNGRAESGQGVSSR
jgi:hypothetical protein